eukprot:TRINITY_DN12977_c0_g1_i1.p1 TRINITY_DN12977_c0_g1~~TRINITY_DN12977_c0_g1_i1.p1  ORF type:complete len:165 (+),score=8.75 TRINITY_DN12977_c0_g1_i1:45-539(+)
MYDLYDVYDATGDDPWNATGEYIQSGIGVVGRPGNAWKKKELPSEVLDCEIKRFTVLTSRMLVTNSSSLVIETYDDKLATTRVWRLDWNAASTVWYTEVPDLSVPPYSEITEWSEPAIPRKLKHLPKPAAPWFDINFYNSGHYTEDMKIWLLSDKTKHECCVVM